MPQTTIPLYFPNTQRGANAYDFTSYAGDSTTQKDAHMENCILVTAPNVVTQSQTVFVEKRVGFEEFQTYESGSKGTCVFATGIGGAIYGCFTTGSTHTIRSGSGAGGVIGTTDSGDEIVFISEMVSPTIAPTSSVLLFQSEGATPSSYFYSQDLSGTTKTFTGDLTSGLATVVNVSSTSNLYSGQRISGTGIPADTRIQSVDSATQITMTAVATASNNTVTITREHLSKIIDSNFPARVAGSLVEMDGYVFAANQTNGRIYNSDVNNVESWDADSYVTYSIRAGLLAGVGKIKQYILAFGSAGIEVFRNAGNPSGSPLIRVPELFIPFGPFSGGSDSALPYPRFAFHKDYVFFSCTSNLSGSSGIWMMGSDLAPKKISPVTIDRIAPGGVMKSFDLQGKTFLHVGSDNKTTTYPSFFYCVETGEWTQQKFAFNAYFCPATTFPAAVALNNTGGKVYYFGDNTDPLYTDDSTAFTQTIVSENINLNNGQPFTINAFRIIGDNQTGGTIRIRTNGNDYNGTDWITRGTFDKTNMSKPVYRGGYYRNHFAFELTDSHDSASRLQALLVDWEPGGR